MLLDYHIHTHLCRHAEGAPANYVKTAIGNGLDEIGFADHCPWPAGFDVKSRMEPSDFPKYKEIISCLRENFPSFPIKYGLEVDWVPGKMDKVWAKLDREDFDYLIGSIHYAGDFPFDNPEIQREWSKKETADMVWQKYFDAMREMILSGKIDILGHFDIPKKFGVYPEYYDRLLKNEIPELLRLAGTKNMAIEINTSGLRKPVREIYPSPEILKIAHESGLLLTFGSDSHYPDEPGKDFDKALELAKFAGYKELCSYSKRVPSPNKIIFPAV